jgi:GNAT superfamily N-acetyltransferase
VADWSALTVQISVSVVRVELARILPLRALYLQQVNFQIRYYACHERGWTDSYLLTANEAEIGYGSIKGDDAEGRDTVFEFFLIPPFRQQASRLFAALLSASRVPRIECQSNDALMTAMLFEFGRDINAGVVLFDHRVSTDLRFPGAVFRRVKNGDAVFTHSVEPPGDYVLAFDGRILATGGFLTHYNPPFADLFMEVDEHHRRKGAGSYLVQEVIKECYRAGRVPAARCSLDNYASRATLTKAGMRECGFMLTGVVRKT